MDVVALLLAAVAFGLFVAKRSYGMAALTVAWVCQLVHLTGNTLHL